MSADEIANEIRDYKIRIEKMIREHGENSDEFEFQKAMLDGLEEQLQALGAPQRAAESNERMKQREIELEILEREDRIGRACGTCERLKSELEEYKAKMGVAASSPERNLRIQAAREEQARHDREFEEAIERQRAENAAAVTEIMARLQAEKADASAASASAASAAAASAAPAKKGLFGSIFGKRGGRKTRRRARKSKKTRKN